MSESGIPMFSRRGESQCSPELAADARQIETALLRALADTGQTDVARMAGISDTRLSRFKNAAPDGGGLQLPEVAAVVAAMGLSIVGAAPGDLVTVTRAEYDALRTLAAKGLAA